jgi:hypothetical protein
MNSQILDHLVFLLFEKVTDIYVVYFWEIDDVIRADVDGIHCQSLGRILLRLGSTLC